MRTSCLSTGPRVPPFRQMHTGNTSEVTSVSCRTGILSEFPNGMTSPLTRGSTNVASGLTGQARR